MGGQRVGQGAGRPTTGRTYGPQVVGAADTSLDHWLDKVTDQRQYKGPKGGESDSESGRLRITFDPNQTHFTQNQNNFWSESLFPDSLLFYSPREK